MNRQSDTYFFDSILFEQLVFTILSRECSRNGKELLSFDEYKKRHTIDLNLLYFNPDAYAPKGIYDDIPTYVEIIGGRDEERIIKKITIITNQFYHIAPQSSKLVIVCQANETILTSASNKKKIDLALRRLINNKRVEIWWRGARVSQLHKKYPIEFKSYVESERLEQISAFDDLEDNFRNSKISERSFSNNNDDVVKELKSLFKKNRISLVLGTGVSISYNKLTWNSLVLKLYAGMPKEDRFISKRKTSIMIGGNNLSISQYIKGKLGQKYPPRLYRILYPKTLSLRKPSRTSLNSICDLIERGNVRKVITYNYDDFLERLLTIPHDSLYTKENYLGDKFPIYHVHGYIPSSCPKDKLEDFCNLTVLTEEEYFRCYSDPSNWQAAIQLETFKDDICLFIGNSVNDYNEKHLLNKTKQKFKHHYAIMLRNEMNVDDMLKVYSYYENVLNVRIVWAKDVSDMIGIIDSL